MQKELNYSSKAIQDLKEQLDVIKYDAPAAAYMIQMLVDFLEKSVKFVLPQGGLLFEFGGFKQSDVDLMSLPYPIMTIEYEANEEDVEDTNTRSSKRIAVAFDSKEMISYLPVLQRKSYQNGMVVFPISYIDMIGKWCPCWGGVFLKYHSELIKVPDEQRGSPFRKSKTGLGMEFGIVPLGEIGLETLEKNSGDALNDVVSVDIGGEQIAVVQLCSALNCENVSVSDARDPDQLIKINKKRLKSKKAPLFQYKILNIKVGETSSKNKKDIVGHHASPRSHLRRGHPRRLPSGKTIWIQNTVVGTTGNINKTYKVTV